MTPELQSRQTRSLCQLAPVIPVIVIKDLARAEGLAQALVTGGLPVLEVTLRSEVALDAIRAMSALALVARPASVRPASMAAASALMSPTGK